MTPRKSFTTPDGTELPLLNLKGKEYLAVQHRLVWFREQCPNWSIYTQIERHELGDKDTPGMALVKAFIKDHTGTVVATAHKVESEAHFPDYLEKAETGAIGRALALCGYGTQFAADELDERERLADAPAEPARRPVNKPKSEPTGRF